VFSFKSWQLYPKERAPGTHWIGEWVGLKAGLDAVVKRKILPVPAGTQTPDYISGTKYVKTVVWN
jgi:hypothetical protein